MKLSLAQQAEFQTLADPLIKFLCENCHPHTTVIIEPTSAVLLEGVAAHVNEAFIKD